MNDNDLIRREDAKNAVYAEYKKGTTNWLVAINRVPAVDAKPVARGEWITIPQEIEMTSWDKRCSVCNAKAQIEHNFCPNCGADMRKEKSYAKQ